jgi:hypothetical protein
LKINCSSSSAILKKYDSSADTTGNASILAVDVNNGSTIIMENQFSSELKNVSLHKSTVGANTVTFKRYR